MRVALFSDTYLPDINGVVTSVETLRQGLVEMGHEVFVVTNHSSLLSLKYENNILSLPGIELKFLFDYNLSGPMNFTAYEIIKGMNLDVIHVHTEFGVGIFARIVARMLDIPLVYTYHTTYEDYTHYVNFFNSKTFDKVAKKAVATLSKMLSNPASILITPSQKTKSMLTRYGIQRPMHVIPTGIDLQRFDDSDLLAHQRKVIRHNYNISEEANVFIFVGRIAEEKNIQLILNAFEKLVSADHELYLLIVGSGPDLEGTKQWISERGLTNQIICTDRIENSQIAGYYHSADAFVSASLTETQGLTYIEAMACGLPIFASDMSVLVDLLYEDETGYLFEDEETLINKVTYFTHLHSAKKDQIKLATRTTVKPYDARIFATSISEVYQEAIDAFRT
ncbi:MAG: glycosyltransferase family 4 protein, partial [Erysipelothrix sp.]|nr:glycosyltransferase family 4 protein [Erysipelothrix sp.]